MLIDMIIDRLFSMYDAVPSGVITYLVIFLAMLDFVWLFVRMVVRESMRNQIIRVQESDPSISMNEIARRTGLKLADVEDILEDLEMEDAVRAMIEENETDVAVNKITRLLKINPDFSATEIAVLTGLKKEKVEDLMDDAVDDLMIDRALNRSGQNNK